MQIPNETSLDADKKLSEVEDQTPSNTKNSMNKGALLETLKKPQVNNESHYSKAYGAVEPTKPNFAEGFVVV